MAEAIDPGYAEFLARKSHLAGEYGFEPVSMPDALFPFQRLLTGWAIRRGRGELAEDCGLGKSLQELVWADNVVRHTNRPVLLLTPLAVNEQMAREAERFGIDAARSPDGKHSGKRVVISNYERLHLFDPQDFSGVVCDESSIRADAPGPGGRGRHRGRGARDGQPAGQSGPGRGHVRGAGRPDALPRQGGARGPLRQPHGGAGVAVMEQEITDRYALYCGDACAVLRGLPDASVHLAVYSPPFATKSGGLYVYSSDERDLSNCIDGEEYFGHYGFVIDQLARLTAPGRINAVHCMDVPLSNAGCDDVFDLAGRIIQAHEARGFAYAGRRTIWKEPLAVRNRTMMKSLHHATLCRDSTRTSIANADWLLVFRRRGENRVPVSHEVGLLSYAGEERVPDDLLRYRGMEGDQKKNLYSQWIWRRYASSVWMDVRIDRVLPYREAREGEDERHVHPLQLDVVERAVVLYSNPGETVLTPFMGVGSEVAGAVMNGRRAVGVELKPSYYRQAALNARAAAEARDTEERRAAATLFDAQGGEAPEGGAA